MKSPLYTVSSASKTACAFFLEFSLANIDLPNPVLNIGVAWPPSKSASSHREKTFVKKDMTNLSHANYKTIMRCFERSLPYNSFAMFVGSRTTFALLIELL